MNLSMPVNLISVLIEFVLFCLIDFIMFSQDYFNFLFEEKAKLFLFFIFSSVNKFDTDKIK